MPAQIEPLRVAALVGSTREGRFAPVITTWLTGHLEQRDDLTADVVDLAETPLPTVFPAFGGQPPAGSREQLTLVSPRLAAADAFVLVTPEYNHSFPASLKNAIDWHGEEWHGKPVGFVSYGGLSGGLRAVEQLRVVMAEVNAMTLRNTVSFHDAWSRFDEDGACKAADCSTAVKTMLDQLAWWGHALRDAKSVRRYVA